MRRPWAEPHPGGGVAVRYLPSQAAWVLLGAVVFGAIAIGTVVERVSTVTSWFIALAVLGVSAALARQGVRMLRRPTLVMDDEGVKRGFSRPITLPWHDIDRIWMGPRGVICLRIPQGWIRPGGRRSLQKTYYLSYRILQGGLNVAQHLVDEWQTRTGREVG